MTSIDYKGSKDSSQIVSKDDKPPTYAETIVKPSASNARSADTVLPAPTVPQVHIYTKHDDIKGVFYIDPSAQRLGEPSTKEERKLLTGSHASFRSRNGQIAIDLGTTGHGAKASAVVDCRNGDINVNILPLSPDRPHISLDVWSRNGNVAIFIPDTYHGVIRLSTKHGRLEFLPALAQVMQTFKMTPKEALIYAGTKTDEQLGDYCQVTTRAGNIVVGISGRDRHTDEVGLLKMVGNAIGNLIR
ncbi:hypothetical protein APHAL10511_004319 [Amanita phalloides]|nr:hypothetical protein APHAL10511_004319 [Amanita phalloides]